MRKLLSLIVLLSFAMIDSAWADETSVATIGELQNAIRTNPSATIHLAADIDMSSWSTIGTFSGTIDGRKGNDECYVLKKLKNSLFNTLDGATIQNVKVDSCSFSLWGNSAAGLLACTADKSVFKNIILMRCSIEEGNLNYTLPNAGLLAGYATGGTITDIFAAGCSVEIDGSPAGLLVGTAVDVTFTRCATNMLCSTFGGKGDLISRADVGGLCGHAEGCSLTSCMNYGSVGAGHHADGVGGLCGYSENTTFVSCRNHGLVMQMQESEWGKIKILVTSSANAIFNSMGEQFRDALAFCLTCPGFCVPYTFLGVYQNAANAIDVVELYDTYSFNNIDFYTAGLVAAALLTAWLVYQAQDPDEVGGICGYADKGSFNSCSNFGFVRTLDAYGGGIVGLAENGTVIRNCLNAGNVVGDEQTGAIVGSLNSGSISNCLNSGSVYVNDLQDMAAHGRWPISGELTNGATESGIFYTISNVDNEGTSTRNVTRQTLASGRVAQALNQGGGDIWRQKVGTNLVPIPDGVPNSAIPAVGSVDNSINDNVDCYVSVKNDDEFKAAISDRNAYIRLTSDITINEGVYALADDKLPFRGIIDGAGYTIKGLTLKNTFEGNKIEHAGLFGFAENATFRNLKIQTGIMFTATHFVGALVGKSSHCTYDEVSLTDSSYVACWGDVVGGLVGESYYDTFSNCTTSSVSHIYGDGWSLSFNADAGGLAGTAQGSTFTGCTNNAEVEADDDHAGGIVAIAQNCTFSGCINNGYVHHTHFGGFMDGDDYLGGIASKAEGCTFERCTNSGNVFGADAYIGGIVGYASGSNVINCLNSASIKGDEQTGSIVGYFEKGNIQNCLTVGKVYVDDGDNLVSGMDELFGDKGDKAHWTNNYIKYTEYISGSGGRALVNAEQLSSGQVAWWLNESREGNSIWRQNLLESADAYPVLDPSHAQVSNHNFTNINVINTETDLRNFASNVNSGNVTATAVLATDIILQNPWIPIGNSTNAFKGAFMGNGHTVTITQFDSSIIDRVGFFGTVNTPAVITDLVVDGNIGTSGNTASGIVAAAEAAADVQGTIQILRCGNKANVTTNGINAGGIIGAVYSCDQLELIVSDCWNSGTISGSESALLCGSFKNKATFKNCWNTGTLVCDGTVSDSFVRHFRDDQSLTLTNCWQLEGKGIQTFGTGTLNSFTTAELSNGKLCFELNEQRGGGRDLVWQQNLGTDSQPEFGNKGLYHNRTVTNTCGTICLPMDILSSEKIQLYSLQSTGDEDIVFHSVESLPAGTPGLFIASETGKISFAGSGTTFATTAGSSLQNGWTLKGTFASQMFNTGLDNLYYVSSGKVMNATQSLTVGGYRAYFEGPAYTHVKEFNILLDETDGMELREKDEAKSTGIYNLAGQRLQKLQKGLNIVNGKKILF